MSTAVLPISRALPVQAQIGDDVAIAVGAIVWPFASVLRGARVGAGSSVGSCAVVDAATVGARCAIGHGAQVHPGVVLGDDVFVGPGAILCNDRWPRTAKDGFDAAALLSGAVRCIVVEDGASIGAGAIVLPGVRIGAGAMIAAGAVVDRDVAAGHLFHRDRWIEPIDPGRSPRRMRPC